MDGAVPAARRSRSKLSGGLEQELVLLLRLWPWRRCDSFCRALSPAEVPASAGLAAPVARPGPFAARSHALLRRAVATPRRSDCLSAPTRTPVAGCDRAHAHWLRAGWLSARLASAVGLFPFGLAPSGPRQRDWV